jgi:hypothetical protein
VADLAEAVGFDGFHEGGEDVLAGSGGLLEEGEALVFRGASLVLRYLRTNGLGSIGNTILTPALSLKEVGKKRLQFVQ